MEGNKKNPLDFYISTTNPTVEKAANRYDSKIILPYKVYKSQYWEEIDKWTGKKIVKKPLDLNYNKVMLAVTPVIRKDISALEKLPEDYAYRPIWREGETSNRVSDVEFFTYDEFVSFIKNAKEKGITAGIVVGAVIALEALFAGPICGASMNPARSLAPAIVSGHLEHLWIYLVAPVLGMLLAIPLYRLVRHSSAS
jgi:hypothetical protein